MQPFPPPLPFFFLKVDGEEAVGIAQKLAAELAAACAPLLAAPSAAAAARLVGAGATRYGMSCGGGGGLLGAVSVRRHASLALRTLQVRAAP